MSNKVSKIKQELLARKTLILNELKYYDKRIEDVKNKKGTSIYCDDESSDSDMEITFDVGMSVTELKMQESKLRTCLQATKELTDLQILQSEVNLLVNPPVFERQPQICEEGLWREVMVECRIDLVSFSMSFFTHQANRPFAPISYRDLQVMPIKVVHENELSRSILSSLTTPGDAIETLRSYSAAHRSRRSTLAKLSENYSESLFMEPLPEGGYMLKCGSLLQISWTLQNKLSPIAPFQHKLTFDLEYMDESYVKSIMQAHKQLGNPTVDTDERTLLLANIIDICLEAQKQSGLPADSAESDIESQISKKLQSVDNENELRKSELMGPPKSLPKKSKSKGKENTVDKKENRKRTSGDMGEHSVKKIKPNARAESNGNLACDVANCKDNTLNKIEDSIKTKDKTTRAKENLKGDAMSSKNLQVNEKQKDIENCNNDNLSNNKELSKKKVLNSKSYQAQSSKDNVAQTNNNNIKCNIRTNDINVPDKVSKTKQSKEKKNSSKTSHAKIYTQNNTKTNNVKQNINQKPKSVEPIKLVKYQITNKENKNTSALAADKMHETQNSPLPNSKISNSKAKTQSNNVNKNVNEQNIKLNSKSLIKKQDLKNVKHTVIDADNDSKIKKISAPEVINGNTFVNESVATNINKISKDINKDIQMLTETKNKKSDLKIVNMKQKNINTYIKAGYSKTLINDTKIVKKRNGTTEPLNIKNDKADIVEKSINSLVSAPNLQNSNVISNMNKSNFNENILQKANVNKKTFKNNVNTNIFNRVKTSTGLLSKKVATSSIKSSIKEDKQNSMKPHKRLSNSGGIKKNPIRISPRKLQSTLSTTQDSSKSSFRSLQKYSNIPRLLKKPTTKPKNKT